MASAMLQQKRQQRQQQVETDREEVDVVEEVTMVRSNGGEDQHMELACVVCRETVGQAEDLNVR